MAQPTPVANLFWIVVLVYFPECDFNLHFWVKCYLLFTLALPVHKRPHATKTYPVIFLLLVVQYFLAFVQSVETHNTPLSAPLLFGALLVVPLATLEALLAVTAFNSYDDLGSLGRFLQWIDDHAEGARESENEGVWGNADSKNDGQRQLDFFYANKVVMV
ncbi:hypothetical protein HMN09_00504400 [Mycena chlorophos]|uniref:Transmembrane protein n=1 Tax=Mycena chlorophos TaxID=658473 RepID=A0A8H6T9N4_MYCCL|nr:hypothetical protein HMN09_00504400 [Mycena chlorophos]